MLKNHVRFYTSTRLSLLAVLLLLLTVGCGGNNGGAENEPSIGELIGNPDITGEVCVQIELRDCYLAIGIVQSKIIRFKPQGSTTDLLMSPQQGTGKFGIAPRAVIDESMKAIHSTYSVSWRLLEEYPGLEIISSLDSREIEVRFPYLGSESKDYRFAVFISDPAGGTELMEAVIRAYPTFHCTWCDSTEIAQFAQRKVVDAEHYSDFELANDPDIYLADSNNNKVKLLDFHSDAVAAEYFFDQAPQALSYDRSSKNLFVQLEPEFIDPTFPTFPRKTDMAHVNVITGNVTEFELPGRPYQLDTTLTGDGVFSVENDSSKTSIHRFSVSDNRLFTGINTEFIYDSKRLIHFDKARSELIVIGNWPRALYIYQLSDENSLKLTQTREFDSDELKMPALSDEESKQVGFSSYEEMLSLEYEPYYEFVDLLVTEDQIYMMSEYIEFQGGRVLSVLNRNDIQTLDRQIKLPGKKPQLVQHHGNNTLVFQEFHTIKFLDMASAEVILEIEVPECTNPGQTSVKFSPENDRAFALLSECDYSLLDYNSVLFTVPVPSISGYFDRN